MTALSKVIGAWFKSEELIFSMLGNDLGAETWELIDKVQFEIKNKKGEMIGVGPEPIRHRTSKQLTVNQKKAGAVRETVVVVNIPVGMKDKYAKEIAKKMETKGLTLEVIPSWREPQTQWQNKNSEKSSSIDKVIEDTLSERYKTKK